MIEWLPRYVKDKFIFASMNKIKNKKVMVHAEPESLLKNFQLMNFLIKDLVIYLITVNY